MNYKSILFIFSVLFIISCNDEQEAGLGDTDTYIKFFGATHSDIAYTSQQTADGGCVLLGTTEIDNEGQKVFKIKVIKVDHNGNQLWQKVYPPFEMDQSDYQTSWTGRSIIVVDDGYIIVGDSIKSDQSDPNQTTNSSLLVMKINDSPTDNTIVSSSAMNYEDIIGTPSPIDYDLLDYDVQGLDLIQDSQGNLRTISNILKDGQVIGTLFNKLNPDLTFDLNCLYESGENFNIVKSLIEKKSGEFAYGGTDIKESLENPKLILTPACQDISSNGGDLLIDNPSFNFTAGQVIATDIGFAMVGTTVASTQKTNVFFALFDINGAVRPNSLQIYTDPDKNQIGISDISDDEDEQGRTITRTNDGGFMIAGSTLADTAGELDILLIKTDGLGNIQWTKVIGNTNEEYATHIRQSSDGSYLIFGNTEFGGIDTMFLIKTDKNGNVN